MHNLTKIKLFRTLLWITYPIAIVLLYPFVLLKKKSASHLFFFFDRYSIGGAPRVHLDILEAASDVPKQVYFTRISPGDELKGAFYSIPNSINKDIHFWCDNLFFRVFSTFYFAFYINRHKDATVLSSNSTFFYDMLPFLRSTTSAMELLHNFTFGPGGMEFFGLANYKFLKKRLVIDANTKKNIQEQYRKYGIPDEYFARVELIEFGVEIPNEIQKDYSSPLRILYAGRGGPQKRIWLINKIAEHLISECEEVEFHFAGTFFNELSEIVKNKSVYHGVIGDKNILNAIFRQCHVLLMTSAYEGFPLVVKEAMAHAEVPVVTALPGNKTHLIHMKNALLVDAIENEDEVVALAIKNLRLLIKDSELLQKLSRNSYDYAKKYFTKDLFLRKYRELLLSHNEKRSAK